jgi:GT2 family glycosyltransferase
MTTLAEGTTHLSIIIVNYETSTYAHDLLATLGQDKNTEVIFIDNSRENTIENIINKEFPYVQYHFTGKNLGFSGGINFGLLEARGEWIFILNADTKVSIEDIKKLLMITKKNNAMVAVPKLTGKNGRVQNNVGNLPSFGKNPIDWLTNKPTFFDCKTIHKEQEVTLVSGVAMLFHKNVIDEIGYFDDQNYFIDFVDFDFSRKLAENKIPIVYIPQVTVVHYTDIPFKAGIS